MADDEDIIGVGMPAEGPLPKCDRCQRVPDAGALMTPELGTVCFDCLTDDEREAFLREAAAAARGRRN